MELTEYEQWRANLIEYYMKQGAVGQRKLAMLAPLLQMYDQKYANEQANRDRKQNERNAYIQQGAGILGQLGGMYMMGQMMGAGAAGAGAAGAGAAGAGAAGAGAAGAGAAGAGAAGAGAAGAGAAGAGAAGGGTSTATTGGAAAGMGTAAIVAAALIAAQNLYETGGKDILKGRGTTADWLNMAMPNMLPRLLGRKSFGRAIVSGKSYDQETRDDYRGALKAEGLVDEDYNVTLADGSKFNVGLDGKTKYTNIDGKTTRNAWDIDLNNPLHRYAAQKLEPYLAKKFGTEGNNREQFVGMIVNAIASNANSEADVDANVAKFIGENPASPTAQRPTQPPTQAQNQPNGTTKGPAPLPAPTSAQPNPQNPFMAAPKLSVGDILRPQSPPPQPAPAPAQKVGFMSTPAAMPPAPTPPASEPTPAPQPVYGSQQQGLLALQRAMQNQSAGQSQPMTPAQPAPQDYGSIADLLRMMAQNGATR